MSVSSLISSIQSLKDKFQFIEKVEYSKISDFYWFNIIESLENRLISDRTFTGFDTSPNIAFSKAVSEFIERKSFQNGYEKKLSSCLTKRSDGFAAYPLMKNDQASAKTKVREKALAEAIERYVWATWWDNYEVKYDHLIFSLDEFSEIYISLSQILREIDSEKSIKKIHLIEPQFENYEDYILKIIVVEFEEGLVTGGACGLKNEELNILARATSELLRHALVLMQNKQKPTSLSFYEKRLLFFASFQGISKFYERIAQRGYQKIQLPRLIIDEQIPSSNTHIVHRCLFQDQPPFINEIIERMCL